MDVRPPVNYIVNREGRLETLHVDRMKRCLEEEESEDVVEPRAIPLFVETPPQQQPSTTLEDSSDEDESWDWDYNAISPESNLPISNPETPLAQEEPTLQEQPLGCPYALRPRTSIRPPSRYRE